MWVAPNVGCPLCYKTKMRTQQWVKGKTLIPFCSRPRFKYYEVFLPV